MLIYPQKPPAGSIVDNDNLITPGLVLALPMNEGTGAKAFDLSGRGNHGVLTSTSLGVDGISLDGAADFVTHDGIGSLTDWTVSARFNPDTVSGIHPIFDQDNILVYQSDDDIVYGFRDAAGAEVVDTGATLLTAGTPVEITVTKSGSVHVLYIDGVQKDTFNDATAPASANASLLLGKSDLGLRYFNFANTYTINGGDVLDADTNDISFSCRLLMATAANGDTLLSKGGVGEVGYSVVWTTNLFKVEIRDEDGNTNHNSFPAWAVDGQWHHFAATADRDGNVSFYKDGVFLNALAAQRPKTLANARNFYIGSNRLGTQIMNDFITDVKIYIAAGAVWSAPQILYQYNNPLDLSASAGTITDSWACDDRAATTTVTGAVNNLTASANTSVFSEGGTEYADGKIGHAEIWNRALTTAEVKALASDPYSLYRG